jgi:UPF0755 protein
VQKGGRVVAPQVDHAPIAHIEIFRISFPHGRNYDFGMKRLLATLLILAALGAVAAGGAFWWWLDQPLSAQTIQATVPAGASAQQAASRVARGTAQPAVQARLLWLWLRVSGKSQEIKTGVYEFGAGATPRDVLNILVKGQISALTFTLIDGWNIRQLLNAVANAPDLEQTIDSKNMDALMAAVGKPGVHPEGRFFPDTYHYAKGSKDVDLLKRAAATMDKRLESAWAARDVSGPLKTANELLILASIVEKETGKASDRPQISGVFHNRLKIGMRMQTDPTVIYGLGESFDGNLRRKDLQTDTPYNTYTRAGLPPTPISMPGLGALMAAGQPAATPAMYFVAKGDGSSAFSATLDEHNRAVRQYQLGQK